MNPLIKRASAEARAFSRAGRKPRKAMPDDLARADLSMRHATPRTEPRFAPVTFSEMAGVRFLHFGTEWVQGAMRLRKPYDLELEYAQQMMAWLLFLDAPAHITQLGLGAASLTKWCHRFLPASRVEAVELNASVVVATRSMFGLPDEDDRLHVVHADAWDYVHDARNGGRIGVMQVDLYDATARGPVLDTAAFYRACRLSLSSPGMLTVNLFGDHPSFARNMRNLSAAFDGRVIALPIIHDGNRIALAFSGPPLSFPWAFLEERAKLLQKTYRLPAISWVRALREASGDSQGIESFSI
ncbi:spermidine synthase [Robbsia andropogonis]|uniref:Spermidine synthase n=1 Tax=Robbsia andropogonis TaxID=28092 RepID=A0A0F5K3P8_9BURK|nr:spermidine synthase [Robbsia andropogonis]KKB64152.1 spermidine synthase [Robbsia andropogonis]MCP1120578.1 spermidine synthase [Robbsia andropogonis]MCP1128751.1 spermidine synthase [Robbsia andropogonis]